VLLALAGCTSSSNNRTLQQPPSDLITLQKPGDTPHQPSKVYVDSVTKVTYKKKTALLVNGTLPDACTKVEEVDHNIKDSTLSLTFKTWRNPDVMCAQVLTSFTFIYDKLSKEELSSHSAVIINGTSYNY